MCLCVLFLVCVRARTSGRGNGTISTKFSRLRMLLGGTGTGEGIRTMCISNNDNSFSLSDVHVPDHFENRLNNLGWCYTVPLLWFSASGVLCQRSKVFDVHEFFSSRCCSCATLYNRCAHELGRIGLNWDSHRSHVWIDPLLEFVQSLVSHYVNVPPRI
jgi:hypothetical protein